MKGDGHMIRIIQIFFMVLILALPGYSRWMTPEESPVEIEFVKRNIYVRKDGTYDDIREEQTKILTKEGLQQYGSYSLRYIEDFESIEILEAKMIIGSKEYNVPISSIEDKPLASQAHGFKRQRQILIVFPGIVQGSTVYIKTKRQVKIPLFPNMFFLQGTFGTTGLTKNTNLKITSEIPLEITVSDPKKSLNLSKTVIGGKYIIDLTLTKPVIEILTVRNKLSYPHFFQGTAFKVCSHSPLEFYGSKYQDYEKNIETKLPKILIDIIDKVKYIKDPAEQINQILISINSEFRYLGDWRATDAGFVPRRLEEIVKTRYGDCKDFSVILAAILRRLGFKANIALVRVGNEYLPSKDPIWGFEINHAIVKAVDNNGHVYWLDATNNVAMATAVFPDIADRPAIVLTSQGAMADKIPAIDPRSAQQLIDITMVVDQDKTVTEGNIELTGEESIYTYKQWCSSKSIKDLEENITHRAFGHGVNLEDSHIKVTLPDSCIVKKISAAFKAVEKGGSLVTNLGIGVPLDKNIGNLYIPLDSSINDNSREIWLGKPRTLVENWIIKDAKVENSEVLDCDIKTPWVEVFRKIEQQGNDILVRRKITILKEFILPEEMNDPKFVHLKDEIVKKFQRVGLIFKSIKRVEKR